MAIKIKEVIEFIGGMKQGKRNWFMPGDGRYQPKELKPFLGYDQWAVWLAVVEWFWMLQLAEMGKIPAKEGDLLTKERLFRMLDRITTTKQDEIERETKHDILALRQMMAKILPGGLHRGLHLGATSYDIISTAYALQAKAVFDAVFWPKLKAVDGIFLQRIAENAEVLQAGRTHLQTALPVTVGFWLAGLHNRFVRNAKRLKQRSCELEGKFSGAVGTYAAQRLVLEMGGDAAEWALMKNLGLVESEISTQIAPPESMAEFYSQMVLLSGALANLGEDVRILQSSQYGEVTSASSTSSAMPHKKANPISAENTSGMHESVLAEYQKVLHTLISNLQRDLRGSNVMRSHSAVTVYTFQQLLNTEKILKSLEVDRRKCQENFEVSGKLVVAEPLHLALQKEGYPNSHHLVNKVIVPMATAGVGQNLAKAMDHYLWKKPPEFDFLKKCWNKTSYEVKDVLEHPEKYLGFAVEIAQMETKNRLED